MLATPRNINYYWLSSKKQQPHSCFSRTTQVPCPMNQNNPKEDRATKDDNDHDGTSKPEGTEETSRAMDPMNASSVSRERVQRLQELDQKHRHFFWRTQKKTKGPRPSPQETAEYKLSVRSFESYGSGAKLHILDRAFQPQGIRPVLGRFGKGARRCQHLPIRLDGCYSTRQAAHSPRLGNPSSASRLCTRTADQAKVFQCSTGLESALPQPASHGWMEGQGGGGRHRIGFIEPRVQASFV